MKHKNWRGFRRENGWNAAPVIESFSRKSVAPIQQRLHQIAELLNIGFENNFAHTTSLGFGAQRFVDIAGCDWDRIYRNFKRPFSRIMNVSDAARAVKGASIR